MYDKVTFSTVVGIVHVAVRIVRIIHDNLGEGCPVGITCVTGLYQPSNHVNSVVSPVGRQIGHLFGTLI